MICVIVMPTFITRANGTITFIIQGSCMFTSISKESSFQEEAIKNILVDFLREAWEDINMPRFIEVIGILWCSYNGLVVIPLLVFVSDRWVI